jgi:hypothetical protein
MHMYEPSERHFEYHMRYYFNLIDMRRGIEDQIDTFHEHAKKVDELFSVLPFDSPHYSTSFDDVILLTQDLLVSISENISNRWNGVQVNNHTVFSYDRSMISEIARSHFGGYSVEYHLMDYYENIRDDSVSAALELAESLTVSMKDYSVVSRLYVPDYAFCVKFDSIDTAIDVTKKYLIMFSED